MNIAERISEVCRKSNDAAMGVLPPQVCPFCFGCPIATVVVGVSGHHHITAAQPIPEDKQPEVNAWLDKIEQRIINRSRGGCQ